MAYRKFSGPVPPHQYIFYGLPVPHSKAVSANWCGPVYCKGGNVSITPETMWEPSGGDGDSEAVDLERGSVLSLSFVEPDK